MLNKQNLETKPNKNTINLCGSTRQPQRPSKRYTPRDVSLEARFYYGGGVTWERRAQGSLGFKRRTRTLKLPQTEEEEEEKYNNL